MHHSVSPLLLLPLIDSCSFLLQSTLMRSIASGQLDGFPPKDELRTVYVEHDIDASEADTPVVEFVYADPVLQGAAQP